MVERRRVLQMGPSPALGGGMSAALRGLLASPLAERYRFDLVATYEGPSPLSRLLVYMRALAYLAGWSLRGRGRVVHVHATVRGSALRKSVCVLLARALGRRVLLHVHSGPGDIATFAAAVGPARRALLAAAFRGSDAVVAVSEASAEGLRAAGVKVPIEVVPNAAPLVRDFSRVWEESASPRLAYLGGFANPVKGADVLVAALREELEARPGLRVALAGPGDPSAPARNLIVDSEGVEWLGWLDPEAKDALLRECEIFVISSRSEGLPMALLEAMGYSMAVVATAVGGIPELLGSDREDGLLVAPGDASALTGAIESLVADPGLRRQLGEAARRRVERLDDVEFARRIEGIYRGLGA